MTSARRRAFGLALTLALTVTACSSTSTAPSADGGTALKMWTFKKSHADALNKAAAQFKAETGIAVTIEAVTPDDVFVSKVQSAAQTGGLPDVLEVHAAGEDMEMGASGLLQDLQADVSDPWKQRLLATAREAGVVTQQRIDSVAADSPLKNAKAGQRFSVPFTAGAFGIVYANKEKLKAAGLDPETPPKTWEEFVAALKATTDKDQGGISLGLKASSTGFNWIYEPLAYAYLGKEKYQGLFGKGTTNGFGSADGVKTLEAYSQLTPYWIPGATTLGIDEADIAFAQGKSAFNIGGTFTLAFLAQNGLTPDKVLTFPIPPSAAGVNKTISMAPLALTGLAIGATAKNRAAAVKWIDWVTSAKGAGTVAKQSLDLPATDLGADAESLLGKDLAALQKYFTGPPEAAYEAGDSSFFPPGFDQAKAGDLGVRLTPLKELTPQQAGQELDKLIQATWKTAQ